MVYVALALGLFLLAVPIAISLLVGGLGYLGATGAVDPIIAAQKVATGIDRFTLMAIPFFLLAAELMNRCGITDRIFRLAKCIVGPVPGGLGYVNVLASMMFASMSGSAVSDAAGLGRIEIRAMVNDGYDRGFSAAVTAASCVIAPILPPSIALVIFGVTAGVSIGGLFLAGCVPGFLMGGGLMVVVYIYSRRYGYGRLEKPTMKGFISALSDATLALLTPVIIVGGIWGGIFTATEAGAFAVLYSILLGAFVYRTIRLRDLPAIFYDIALSSANILFIIAVSALVAWILTLEQVPLRMAELIVEWAPNKWVFLALLNGILVTLGCFMAAIPVIIMLVPILFPAAIAMGINEIHFGMVMVLNLMIGLITPPVGVCLFAVAEVAEIQVFSLVKSLLPFFVPLAVVLMLVTFVPELSLWLPRLFGYASG